MLFFIHGERVLVNVPDDCTLKLDYEKNVFCMTYTKGYGWEKYYFSPPMKKRKLPIMVWIWYNWHIISWLLGINPVDKRLFVVDVERLQANIYDTHKKLKNKIALWHT